MSGWRSMDFESERLPLMILALIGVIGAIKHPWTLWLSVPVAFVVIWAIVTH